MPWKEVTVMEEKRRFIEAYLHSNSAFSVLCATFGISTKTGYKYLMRYRENGLAGLKEMSRQPKTSPTKTLAAIENLIVEIRHLHPVWAGEKIQTYLRNTGQLLCGHYERGGSNLSANIR
jgi:transposase